MVYLYWKKFVEDSRGNFTAVVVKNPKEADIVSASSVGELTGTQKAKLLEHVQARRSDFIFRSECKGKVNREKGTYLNYGVPMCEVVDLS